jgi:hypothetical protein
VPPLFGGSRSFQVLFEPVVQPEANASIWQSSLAASNRKVLITMKCIEGLIIAVVLSPSLSSAAVFNLQEGVSPTTGYIHSDTIIRDDNGLGDTIAGAAGGLLIGSHPGSGPTSAPGHLRSLIEFDLAPIVADLGSQQISSVSLKLWLTSVAGMPTVPRVDGTPKVDVYQYGFPVLPTTATWNDPDGDGNPATGDLTAGGTLGAFLGTFGELNNTLPFDHSIAGGVGSPLVLAFQNALATDQKLRLVLVEDQADTATRDIAFFKSSALTGGHVPQHPLLTIETVTLPGDFNSDGDVDGDDFSTWQTSFPTQSEATLTMGDADGDGDVDGADFVVWQTNYHPLVESLSTVPEPQSFVMLAIMSILCFAGRSLRFSGQV